MKYTRDSDRFVRQIQTQKKLRLNRSFRAIDGARTRGLDLGKVARIKSILSNVFLKKMK